MKKLVFFIFAFSIHFAAQANDEFSTVEERMTGKEFRETGLVKLTDAELAVLNDWLRRHSVATLENATARPADNAKVDDASAKKDMRGFGKQPKGSKEDDVIYSSIVGTFDGWRGKGTLFKLANGMIWQQVENDSFSIEPVENPKIEIRRGFMGNWRLKTASHNSAVRVKRIQ